ncbi:hypothetical protein RRG08_015199 [Elysia crispata]|uniref:Uncharacterized protein n=1 Tax=Elysia crispata TaxID=231223 RepID=A0AAE1AYH2_9GAST|nr:hypothetical protein RRG08_015199 [Elysia crispata]
MERKLFEGLHLELFIDQKAYVPHLANEAEVRVVIHKRGSIAFPEDKGLSIRPGRSTSIALQQVLIERLPKPHGSCVHPGEIDDNYTIFAGTDYSKLSCLKVIRN